MAKKSKSTDTSCALKEVAQPIKSHESLAGQTSSAIILLTSNILFKALRVNGGKLSDFVDYNSVSKVISSLFNIIKDNTAKKKLLVTPNMREMTHTLICFSAALTSMYNKLDNKRLIRDLNLSSEIIAAYCANLLDKHNLSEYAGMMQCEQQYALCRFYKDVKKSLHEYISERVSGNSESEEALALFHSLDDFPDTPAGYYPTAIAAACEQSKDFEMWILEQKRQHLPPEIKVLVEKVGHLSEMLKIEQDIPNKSAIHGGLNLRHCTRREYVAQRINFKRAPHTRKSSISARPTASQEPQKWYESLTNRLSQKAILLLAPGGMGKTTFLTYLFNGGFSEEIAQAFTPFSQVILLSLSSVIPLKVEPYLDTPFSNPNRSLLLQRIASAAGKENQHQCGNWLDLMQQKTERPILLLLDGLNEMRVRKGKDADAYRQVINEISVLSNRASYPGVYIIITSRVESDEDRYNIIADLNEASYFEAELGGISGKRRLPHIEALSKDMQQILMRPMYYRYFKSKKSNLPTTRYMALKEMYSALCQQAHDNTLMASDSRIRKCALEYFLPVMANYMMRINSYVLEDINPCLAQIKHPCTLRLIERDRSFELFGQDEALAEVTKFSNNAWNYLLLAEQLIETPTGQYFIFSHQDFQDFLAAEFYIQRLIQLKQSGSTQCWDSYWDSPVDGMDITQYTDTVKHLVHEAVLGDGAKQSFRTYFETRLEHLKTDDIVPGYLTWMFAAHQIQDVCHEPWVDIDALQAETLHILFPLAEYVQMHKQKGILDRVEGKHAARLMTMLTKICELLRRQGEFDKARDIINAAYTLWDKGTTQYSQATHSLAKVKLYTFQDYGENEYTYDELTSALEQLQACARGIGEAPPYIHSCTLLAMLLVSPQPILRVHPAYQQFLNKITQGTDPSIVAFWTLYHGIFQDGVRIKQNNPIDYSVRQMMSLLAENRIRILVQGKNVDAIDVSALDLAARDGYIKITTPETTIPVPTTENCYIIKGLCDLIGPLKYPYFYGLAEFITEQEKNLELVLNLLSKAAASEVRAKMWIAFLGNDFARLENIMDETRKQNVEIINATTVNPVDDKLLRCLKLKEKHDKCYRIDTYNFVYYFERDIEELYFYMKTHRHKRSK